MRISAAASAARMTCRRSSSTCSLRCRVRCMRAADLAADKRRSYSIRVSSCSKQHNLAQQVCGNTFKRLLLLPTVPLLPAPHAGGEFVSLKDVLALAYINRPYCRRCPRRPGPLFASLTNRGLMRASFASSLCRTSSLCLSAASCTARRLSSATAAWCARRAASYRSMRQEEAGTQPDSRTVLVAVFVLVCNSAGSISSCCCFGCRLPWCSTVQRRAAVDPAIPGTGGAAVYHPLHHAHIHAPLPALLAAWPCVQPQPAPLLLWLPAGRLLSPPAS